MFNNILEGKLIGLGQRRLFVTPYIVPQIFIISILQSAILPVSPALANTISGIYFADSGRDEVLRANLDGSNMEVIASGLLNPDGVGVAIAGGKVYWSEQTMPRVIRRSNLDGTNAETVITFPYGTPNVRDIVVDENDGKIYVEGSLLDGTPFTATDCVKLVGRED
ncbi:MAG: hypothetical protein JSV03_11085 [Planctomycetota bacterium]|nr:MAG: hypothetical protein JSV03_11085 [Planctomycetota bacterium]